VLEISRLIAEVKEKDDVRILPGDPAFALVTLNQLTLEELAKQLNNGVRAGIAEFTETVRRTEGRAGAALAQQTKTAVAAIRQELQRDIETARLDAAEAVRQIHHAYRRSLIASVCIIIICTLLTAFIGGIWVGATCSR
jgi:hypothetical protein